MISGLYNALTGLTAASRSFAATAHNVAHYGATGRLADQAAGETGPFRLFDTASVSLAGGGVRALRYERDPGSVPLYAPQSPFADQDGMVALANVDLTAETVDSIRSRVQFMANLKSFGTADEMLGALLNKEI